jgi:hypothetical protein
MPKREPRDTDIEHVLLNQIAIMRMLDVMAKSLGLADVEPSAVTILRHRLQQTAKLYREQGNGS